MPIHSFPTLPPGHKRFSVEQTLIDVAPALGLSASALHALLHMMKATSPSDWTDPNREPVFFGEQQATAAAIGRTSRALYTIERRLEALGLVERRVKANGQRSSVGRCGILFSPLIALFPRLLHMAQQGRQERRLRRSLAAERSSLLRYIRSRLPGDGTESAGFRQIVEQLGAWPRADALCRLSLEALQAHVAGAKALCVAVDDILSPRDKSSGAPARNFRCHIQESNPREPSVVRNAVTDERGRGQSLREDCPLSEPHGRKVRGESAHESGTKASQSRSLSWLTPAKLFGMASPDMQALLAAERGERDHLRITDFFAAAHGILPHLGIHRSAWTDAIETMGVEKAWLAILTLDANRDHPQTPVRSAGGALRAVTRLDRQGKFHLDRSLIGLAVRKGLPRGSAHQLAKAGRRAQIVAVGMVPISE